MKEIGCDEVQHMVAIRCSVLVMEGVQIKFTYLQDLIGDIHCLPRSYALR